MSKFKINLSGFNGLYTGATIVPQVNMPTPLGIIVKINEKSIIVRKNETDEHTTKLESLNFPLWFVPQVYKKNILDENGDAYIPNDIEKAIITLIQIDSHDAIVALGSISEYVVKNTNLKEERVTDNFSSSLSPATVFATINQLVNY
jgi:hypothetical protein